MGRKTVRSGAAACPRCAALLTVGAPRCGICHLDLAAAAAAAAAPAETATELAPEPVALDTAPEPEPEPVPAPVPALVPDPVALDTAPEPAPELEPVPVPALVPDPVALDTAPEPAPAPEPEPVPVPALVPEPVAFTDPAASAVAIPAAPPTPPFTPSPRAAAITPTRGLTQALTIVAALSAIALVLTQVFVWLVARQTSSAFEQALSVDANGQFVSSDPAGSLAGAAFAAALAGLSGLAWIGLAVASVVLFLIWQARAMANAAVIAGRPMRYATAPALICWFLPVVNLFIPWMNLKDTGATTFAASHGARARQASGLITAWWAVWIGTGVVAGIDALSNRGSAEADIALTSAGGAIQALLLLTATVLMIVVVRSIGAAQSALAAPSVAQPRAASPFDGQFGTDPTPPHAGSPSGALISASTPTPPVARVNPRDPFSWPAPQPPSSNGPTFP